jgi:hypothetical protein
MCSAFLLSFKLIQKNLYSIQGLWAYDERLYVSWKEICRGRGECRVHAFVFIKFTEFLTHWWADSPTGYCPTRQAIAQPDRETKVPTI